MSEPKSQIINDVTGCAEFTGASGRTVHVLFDIEAVMAVEQTTGKSVFDLLSGRPGLTDMIYLLMAGSRGYGRRPGVSAKPLSPERASKFVVDCGGVLAMLPTMLRSLTKAEGIGLDIDDEDDEVGEPADDAGPPGRGATS